MKKLIVFGGEGLIGRHLAACLLAKGDDVTSVDLEDSKRGEGAARRFVAGDVRLPISDQLCSSPPPVIFNLAAVLRTPGHPMHEYFETNLKGADHVCEYARKTNARTIVFTSSMAAYGTSEYLKTEDTLPTPNTAYGISKLVAEHIHRTWQAEKPDERRLVIVRPGVVFGRGERGKCHPTLLGLASQALRLSRPHGHDQGEHLRQGCGGAFGGNGSEARARRVYL